MTGLTSFSNSATSTRGASAADAGAASRSAGGRSCQREQRDPARAGRASAAPILACKDSVKQGSRPLVGEGSDRHCWRDRREEASPPAPARARLRAARAALGRATRPSSRATSRSAAARALAQRCARRASTSSALHWRAPGRRVPDAVARRAAGARGPTRRRRRRTARLAARARAARAARLAARQPVVGRAVRPDRVPAPRRRHPAARLLRLEPEASYVPARTLQRAGAPPIVPRAGWKRRRVDRRARSRPTRRRSASRSSTTPPARTATRGAVGGDRARRSSSTT